MLTRSPTRGTSQSDDGLRQLLSVYVACRMHERYDCRHCHTRPTSHMKTWNVPSMRKLLKSGLDEFLLDVMAQIPMVCTLDDELSLI